MSMEMLLYVVFGCSMATLLYAYGGYPVLVRLWGRFRPRPVAAGPSALTVTVVIAAYNEEEVIGERLANLFATDYPGHLIQAIIASDGSTDRTEAIVSSVSDDRVHLMSLPRQGKIPALNEAVRHARGEILVFSDANTEFERNTLTNLLRSFKDPAVGGVVGNTGYKIAKDSESSSHGENLYWGYDTGLKEAESRCGSVVSAHGGLYAIRRELFEPPQDASVTDDFFISTGVVAKGRRLVFEKDARAYEYAVVGAQQEFGRRVRLMTRGIRSLYLRRNLLNHRVHGFYSVALASRKLVRRLTWFALFTLLASSIALAGSHPVFLVAALAQVGFYGVALVGWALRRRPIGRHRVFYVPFFFCMANLAAMLATLRFIRGDRIALWQPQRHASVQVGA